MKIFRVTDAKDVEVYFEGAAEPAIELLLNNGVKFVDRDGKRLHVSFKHVRVQELVFALMQDEAWRSLHEIHQGIKSNDIGKGAIQTMLYGRDGEMYRTRVRGTGAREYQLIIAHN